MIRIKLVKREPLKYRSKEEFKTWQERMNKEDEAVWAAFAAACEDPIPKTTSELLMTPFKLFIDDDAGKEGSAAFRNPPDKTWRVARSSKEAIEWVETIGEAPSEIDFDHDLGKTKDGKNDTSIIFLDWLIENYYDADVSYRIHSMNPEGSENIKSKMESWKKSKNL
jgi:hypothetical protein